MMNGVAPSPRISSEDVAFALVRVGSMSLEDKLAVMDEIHASQPNMLASLLVQKGLGVSLARMDTLANILLICFIAMHRARPTWPVITEKLQDQHIARFVGAVEFSESLPRPQRDQALADYVAQHPEQPLLAMVYSELKVLLESDTPEESDKYLMLAAMNYVNCIAHVDLPAETQSRSPKRRRNRKRAG